MANNSERESNMNEPFEFELEYFLPYRLSLLINTISRGIAGSYQRKHDISVTEWRVMAVLGRYSGLTASEVVERTAMDKVAISRTVKSLVDKGLLERKTDPGDRRRRRLYITHNRGQKVLQEIVPLAQSYEQKLLQAMSARELKNLEQSVAKLLESARKLDEALFQSRGQSTFFFAAVEL